MEYTIENYLSYCKENNLKSSSYNSLIEFKIYCIGFESLS